MDVSTTSSLIAAAALGYLLGAIPFGLLFTRAAGLGDIRTIGSGNIGATNVLRTGNKTVAAATLVCDVAKATVAVIIAPLIFGDTPNVAPFAPAHAAAIGVFVGHLFPVWLRFRGGKGVATYLGVLIGINPPLALVFVATWLATAWIMKVSSLAALVAVVLTPLAAVWLDTVATVLMLLALSTLLFAKHRTNIHRLVHGTEPRIGKASREVAQSACQQGRATDAPESS